MNLIQVAQMIPAHYRKTILDTDAIFKAVAVPSDQHMMVLFTIWTTYVNPGSAMDAQCTKCLGMILGHYKALKEHFIQLQQDENYLAL